MAVKTTFSKDDFRYYESRSKNPCPAPIRNIHGGFLGMYKNKPFILLSFMKGEHRKNADPKLVAACLRNAISNSKDNKLVAVLDFDDASYVYLLYDVANMIYFWAWPDKRELNFDKAKDLLREYGKYRKLTKAEKEHLYDLLKMVIFMSIGWFIHDNDSYRSNKKKIEDLYSMGRKEFYDKMFR